MKIILTLTRYQLLILARNPGYWVMSLVLAALGITVFGYLVSNPTTPRLGIVDEARNEFSQDFARRAKEVEAFHVLVGSREDQMEKLRSGDRWAVVALPDGFGTAGAGGAVEVWTGGTSAYPALTGSGIIRQLVAETVGEAGAGALRVEERPVAGQQPLRFIDFVVPGQVGLSLMFGNLFAAGLIAWWREEGTLRRVAVTPVSPRQLLGSQLLVFGLLSSAQAATLLTLGWLLFDVSVRGSYLALALTVGAGILAFLTLWYTFAAFIRSAIAVNGASNLVAIIMLFVGGSYLPLEDPPALLRPLVAAAPLKYLNDALREIINRGHGLGDVLPQLAVLAAWALGLFYISSRLFRWTTE